MFDKLVASEPAGTDAKNRRNYFMVSTVVVSVVFLGLVVVSIFADDFSLGSDSLEIEALLAPVTAAAPEVEPPKPQVQNSSRSDQRTTVPTRTENLARTDEFRYVPDSTSSTANNAPSRPNAPFAIGPINSDGPVGPVSRPESNIPGDNTFRTTAAKKDDREEEVIGDPPPIRKPPVQSKGVVNGLATSLPKPSYSAAAKAVHASGAVNVQVTIDEQGNVISAKASSGHPMLRPEAERAARSAHFTPTKLSNVAVKVTGVIVYNFVL